MKDIRKLLGSTSLLYLGRTAIVSNEHFQEKIPQPD